MLLDLNDADSILKWWQVWPSGMTPILSTSCNPRLSAHLLSQGRSGESQQARS